MLDKEGKNIDACTIGTRHMHATIALACMQRGKHVYVEKPLTELPGGAAVAGCGGEVQSRDANGEQGFPRSHRVASEMIWSGAIGDVRSSRFVHAGLTRRACRSSRRKRPFRARWIGPLAGGASCVRSAPIMCLQLAGFFDFGTGQIGNWASTAWAGASGLQLNAPTSVELISQESKSRYTFRTGQLIRSSSRHAARCPGEIYWHDSPRPATPKRTGARDGERDDSARPNNLTDKAARWGPGRLAGRCAAAAGGAAPRRSAGGGGGPGVAVFEVPGSRRRPAAGVLTAMERSSSAPKHHATCDRGKASTCFRGAVAGIRAPSTVVDTLAGHMLDWCALARAAILVAPISASPRPSRSG